MKITTAFASLGLALLAVVASSSSTTGAASAKVTIALK